MQEATADACLACLKRGLHWIAVHLEYLRPENPSQPEYINDTAELSMLYGYLISWGLPRDHADLRAIRDFLRDVLSERTRIEYVRKLPAPYTPYVVAYLPLRAAGEIIPEFEDALEALRRAGYPDAQEWTPQRELELQSLTWKAGLRKKPPDCDGIYRRTTLGRGRNPIQFSAAEIYSITHTLFHLADVAGPAEVMPPAERLRAGQIAETLLVHFWRKRDWGVSGELLINLIALDQADTGLFHSAMGALLAAWPENGALPGPGYSATDDAETRDVVSRCCHTTLVGLLLCGALLWRMGRMPQESAGLHG